MNHEMHNLRVSIVQGETRWHDPAGNRDYYGDLIAPLHGTTDLVVLPETFTSGFSNDALAAAEARKAKLEGAVVTIHANASTEGKLYGSVGPREIADALTKAGTEVSKSEVVLGEGAFRTVGEYEVVLHLHADVETPVKVNVVAEAA